MDEELTFEEYVELVERYGDLAEAVITPAVHLETARALGAPANVITECSMAFTLALDAAGEASQMMNLAMRLFPEYGERHFAEQTGGVSLSGDDDETVRDALNKIAEPRS